jgi:SAM-dependent methyltransferase
MNRKQRRAAVKQRPPAGEKRGGDGADQLYAQALGYQQQNRLDDAVRAYKRLLALKPGHAQGANNLGVVLLTQGKLDDASTRFAQALTLMPQLFDQFGGIVATLAAVLPPIGEALRLANAAWPDRLPLERLLGAPGFAAIAADPMLLCLLQSTPVRDLALERLLTSLRLALLTVALEPRQPLASATLAFACVLAKQCFINEYIFAGTPAEDQQVAQLETAVGDAAGTGASTTPLALAVLAMYRPLHRLPFAPALLTCAWPKTLDGLLTQQLREPAQELALRASIAQLAPIDDATSQRVRQQYEESPYPRWVNPAGAVEPIALERYLRDTFPGVTIDLPARPGELDTLVAGCGTGWHAIATAQKYLGARLLAVDLSLSSLAYAKRKTPAALSKRIDYLQADILTLGSLGRSFDMVDASGVLHHMVDPLEGWRILLTLLRPGGFIHLGFYSEVGRRDVVAARGFIAERGYAPTPDGIRRCRQELLASPLSSLTRFDDFFTTSECRDLLFHVQESRMTIPAIKDFLDKHGLKFIGFEFGQAATQHYAAHFANTGWSMSDLDCWHAFETQHPNTFSAMYQLWVQKSR